jgi:hypothetical protein
MTPETASDLRFYFVAGAGFEPATSGRHRGHRDYYGLMPEATDSLGVVRDMPSLPRHRIPAQYRVGRA